MIVYIDNDYKCHASNPDGAFREVDEAFFDGKCATFIEGYRYIPAGEVWVDKDGAVFSRRMATSWKDYSELYAAQAEYERNRAEIERLQAVVVDAEEAQAAYEEGVQLA